jgi:hypothetical protein
VQAKEGLASTRSGSAPPWEQMIGRSPIGDWELALPDTPQMRARFAKGDISDVLFVLTVTGSPPEWPE